MAADLSAKSVLLEKKLFTPGPLGVSQAVRDALNKDVGSRDAAFINVIQTVRKKLVEIAGFPLETHTAILMQGSGTFSVEAVLNSTCDRTKKVLILACGAYGKRMQLICERAAIPSLMIEFPENEPVSLDANVRSHLESGEFSALALVHCETTSGLLNPIREIGVWVKTHVPSLVYIVDAMSSFAGIDEKFENIDFLVSSANKCLQGVPGLAFVIADKKRLQETRGRSTSLSLDLFDQWAGLESNGQFRFTPPTHCLLALMEAISELEREGGVPARAKRYRENNRIVKDGMTEFGFIRFVEDRLDGPIITSFQYPNHTNFQFEEFYNRLSDKGQLIYPGKVTNADCFRIGNIGHLFPADMHHLLKCIKEVLTDMNIPLPVRN